MMGEMGIDWGSAPDYTSQLVVQLEQMRQAARQAAADVSSWAVFVTGGGAADWAGYNVPAYLAQPILARRRNERQFRRRRHAGHHGGIRRATLVAGYRKMEPRRGWAVEGYTR